MLNFAFINIFYIGNVSVNADYVKAIHDTFSLTVLAEDISSHGKRWNASEYKPEKVVGLYSTELSYFVINF